jgi:hypothetical protein
MERWSDFPDASVDPTEARSLTIVQGQPPGRYDVDEIRADPFPSGHTSRSWGRMIRHPDGRVEDEPWPWDRAGS